MLLLELHMFYVQLYIHCTLHVCVVSLTYYKIGFPLICNMFCFIFQYVCTVNVNDNHIQNIIGHAIQLWKFVYNKKNKIYMHTHTHTYTSFCTYCSFLVVHYSMLIFVLCTVQSNIHVAYPPQPCFYWILIFLLFMPK